MSDVSKQLGLQTISVQPYNVSLDQQLGMGTYGQDFLNFSIKLPKISLRSADYRETGKLGKPNDATLADAKKRAYSQYPESIASQSPEQIQSQIDSIQLDIDQAYSQLGERKTSFGALLGKEYKGTGTCGKDHACMNRALATIKEFEDRLTILKQNLTAAENRQSQMASSSVSQSSDVSTKSPSKGITYVVIGVAGIAVIISIIAVVKKLKKG